jgi:hypothetical protein
VLACVRVCECARLCMCARARRAFTSDHTAALFALAAAIARRWTTTCCTVVHSCVYSSVICRQDLVPQPIHTETVRRYSRSTQIGLATIVDSNG